MSTTKYLTEMQSNSQHTMPICVFQAAGFFANNAFIKSKIFIAKNIDQLSAEQNTHKMYMIVNLK